MTVCVIRVYPKKVVVAADTFISGGYPGHYTKFLIHKGKICCTAGSQPYTDRFEAWFLAGMQRDKIPNNISDKAELDAFIWDNKKGIWSYFTPDAGFKVNSLFFAIGSGSRYALGALEMGATPEEAVRIASKYDPHSKLPLRSMTLERK